MLNKANVEKCWKTCLLNESSIIDLYQKCSKYYLDLHTVNGNAEEEWMKLKLTLE
jgi:hypothetical protein